MLVIVAVETNFPDLLSYIFLSIRNIYVVFQITLAHQSLSKDMRVVAEAAKMAVNYSSSVLVQDYNK